MTIRINSAPKRQQTHRRPPGAAPITESFHQQFLAEIARFQRTTGMSDALIGMTAVRDSSFLHRYRSGMRSQIATVDRVRAWMRGYLASIGK